MRASRRRSRSLLLAGAGLLSALPIPSALGADDASRSCSTAPAPLSGVVTRAGAPVPGATLLVTGLAAGAEIGRTLKAEADGTFVWPDACPGLYTVIAMVPGSLPVVSHLMHRAARDVASFVRLDLRAGTSASPAASSPGGFLPRTALGSADPWVARAVVRGDALREQEPILGDLSEPPAAAVAEPARAGASSSPVVPVSTAFRASVASVAGFGSDGDLSRTSLGISGRVGPGVRWGLEGQYARLVSADGTRTGDGASVALDVAPGEVHSIRVSSRLTRLPTEDLDSRYAAHAVDWSATTPGSEASVSARMISQSNLGRVGPVSSLFSRSQETLELLGRYQRDLSSSTYLRVTLGYHSAVDPDLTGVGPADRRAAVGGAAGLRLLSVVRIEGGATGEFSSRTRGVTPELTLAIEPGGGLSLYGFASRRYEDRLGAEPALLGRAGTDEADLAQLTRSLYRAGLKLSPEGPVSFVLEGSRREIDGVYRYLVDPEFLDRLDSLYFFAGDTAEELSSQLVIRVSPGLSARIGGRFGRVHGERPGAVREDHARYGIASANVRVPASGTEVSVGYRVVVQTLRQELAGYQNDLSAVDVSLAQPIPLPLLQGLGSEWRALFSMELGRRVEGESASTSQRWAGGLAISF